MTRSKFSVFAILAALALFVSACTGESAAPTSWPGLTVSGDTVYVAYGKQVHALNLENGQERWAYPTKENSKNEITFYADPAIADDLLVVGGYNKTVYGLDVAGRGTEKWNFAGATDHIVGGAVTDGKIVFVPSADYNLYALDAATGEQRWTFTAKQAIWATPLLDNGRLYVASLDHHLYALNASNGKVIWDRQLGGAIAGTPALAGGTLIVGAFDNKLYAVSAADGSIKWTRPTDGWVWSGPLVADGMLYFGDLAGTLYAADAATGAVKWQVKHGGALRGTPALADGKLYVATQSGFLYARSAADGSELWKVEIGGQLLSSPAVAKGLVVVAAYGAKDNQIVFALDPATGREKWNFIPPK